MSARLVGEGKHTAKRALGKVSRAVWRDPLDRHRTIQLLTGHEIGVTRDETVWLPRQDPMAGTSPRPHGQELVFDPEHVWRIERDERIKSIRITPSGTVLLGERYLLDTDRGSWAGMLDRPLKHHTDVDLAIAPWSHKWGTFGDYLLFVVAKLCRIRDVLDEASWAAATLCYPMRRTSYEQQYLARLGFSSDRLLDTREGIRLSARAVVTANNQSTLWLPSPTGVLALRRTFMGDPERSAGTRRFYVSRSRWRRKVRNEDDVRRVVASFGLEILEDVPTSLDEQIRLFREASLIVSPHGSALTNLVWCGPGTRVIELFSNSYVKKHFAYISHLLHLDYAYLVDDSPKSDHWTNVDEDMSVDVQVLERALEASGAP
jgi:hypothetical protein